jgi:hypothetical protein
LELDNDDQIETVMGYLREKAQKSCYDSSNKNEVQCKCLSCLDDHSSNYFVALKPLWFAQLEKETQQLLLIEKIHATKLCHVVVKELPMYCLPFTTELQEVAEVLGEVKICKFAMMVVLRMSRRPWFTCKQAVDSGTNPQHELKGRECPRSNNFKLQVEPGLQQFFKSVILPLSGPCPTHSTKEHSGAINKEDFEDFTKQDLEWRNRQLFGKYCWDLGFWYSKGLVQRYLKERIKMPTKSEGILMQLDSRDQRQ